MKTLLPDLQRAIQAEISAVHLPLYSAWFAAGTFCLTQVLQPAPCDEQDFASAGERAIRSAARVAVEKAKADFNMLVPLVLIEFKNATISPILFQMSDMLRFSSTIFDRTFRFIRPSSKDVSLKLAKSLATKLVILFQHKAAVRMYRSSNDNELSLFDRNGARKYLTSTERKRFLSAIETLDPKKRLFCLMMMRSGGRVSEILALTPTAIDLDNGDVALLTLKRRRSATVRQIPLPRSMLLEIDRQFRLRSKQSDPSSRHRRLWPWSRATAWRLIKRVMMDASINTPASSPKGLRHTFGVSAFQARVPPHLVQRWLGHATLRTTSIYGDVQGDEERDFARRMWRRK